ncbi:MAG TPA: hypothetical protein VNQ73_16110 [Ilumatobacter sp.]|nr:hypothetical protein [Ilumatobacter sp.]
MRERDYQLLKGRLDEAGDDALHAEASAAGIPLGEVDSYAQTFRRGSADEVPFPASPEVLADFVEVAHAAIIRSIESVPRLPKKQKKRVKSTVAKAGVSAVGGTLLTITNVANPAALPISFALAGGALIQAFRDLADLIESE